MILEVAWLSLGGGGPTKENKKQKPILDGDRKHCSGVRALIRSHLTPVPSWTAQASQCPKEKQNSQGCSSNLPS